MPKLTDKVNREVALQRHSMGGHLLVALAQSRADGSKSSEFGTFARTGDDRVSARVRDLSDPDLIEMWLRVIDPDNPTVVEAAVRDELARREIMV